MARETGRNLVESGIDFGGQFSAQIASPNRALTGGRTLARAEFSSGPKCLDFSGTGTGNRSFSSSAF